MLGKKKVVLISVLLAYAIVVPVFAYLYVYTTPVKAISSGIILQNYTPTMQLGYYWDAYCTQNVTEFDFGAMPYPDQVTTLYQCVYIKNEGNVTDTIYWNSTLSTVSNQIQDEWNWYTPYWNSNGINGTTLGAGQVLQTWYMIQIPAYANVGTFNWTVNVWGANYY